jgi:hypothetical protein
MYCLKQKTDWEELIHFYDIKSNADAAEAYLILFYLVRHLILAYMSLTLTYFIRVIYLLLIQTGIH